MSRFFLFSGSEHFHRCHSDTSSLPLDNMVCTDYRVMHFVGLYYYKLNITNTKHSFIFALYSQTYKHITHFTISHNNIYFRVFHNHTGIAPNLKLYCNKNIGNIFCLSKIVTIFVAYFSKISDLRMQTNIRNTASLSPFL